MAVVRKPPIHTYGTLIILVPCIACLIGMMGYASVVNRRKNILVDAISHHDLVGVKRQLQSGTDPNFQIFPPQAQSLRRLFSGVICGAPPIRNTPLILAAKEGDDAIVQLLLSYGADINAQEPYSQKTALIAAIDAKHETTVELLLQNGADPYKGDFNRYTATIAAVQSGKPAILGLVVKHNAFCMTKDVDGMNALDWAKYLKDKAMIRLVEGYARRMH